MAYQEPDDTEPDGDTDEEYRRQQMKALQQQNDAEPQQDNALLQTGKPPLGGATTKPVIETPPASSPGAAGATAKPAAESGLAGSSTVPAAPKPAAGPPTVNDPNSVKEWVIAEAKRLGRPDIAGNPDYWVQQAIAHSDKGDGTVDTGYWSNRMAIANKGLGGPSTLGGGQMMPAYLGGAGPGNFSAFSTGQQQLPYGKSDTLQQILEELAASNTGQQSPLARRLQMQQLQDAQTQE